MSGFFVENSMNVALHYAPQEKTIFKCARCEQTFSGKPRQILDEYREHVESVHAHELEYCGCCGGQHFPEFAGDCREDFDRF